MISAQIVCKNTTKDKVRKALKKFGLEDRLTSLRGHYLVELPSEAPSDEVLTECRTCAYSYMRLAAWERGGACETTSEAVCVAGDEGQPLVPIVERLGENNANKNHALFVSKSGLATAVVVRNGRDFGLRLIRSVILSYKVKTDIILADEFSKSPQQWLEDYRGTTNVDKFIPLIRAVLRKSECVFCGHCHYREIEERSGK